MDSDRFDVYLSGRLAEGISADAAAASLAQLFRSTPQAMAPLICGKPQLLKRNVDRATAAKYRDALQRVGVLVAFRPLAGSGSDSPEPAVAPAPPPPAAGAALTLAPAEGELLRPEERPVAAAVVVDISAYQLAPPGNLPGLESAPPAPPPATQHLGLAAVGSDFLNESERTPLPVAAPDTAGLSLAPVGAPLEGLASSAVPLDPATDHLQLAPAGSDLLEPSQRQRQAPAPPATDHLKLV